MRTSRELPFMPLYLQLECFREDVPGWPAGIVHGRRSDQCRQPGRKQECTCASISESGGSSACTTNMMRRDQSGLSCSCPSGASTRAPGMSGRTEGESGLSHAPLKAASTNLREYGRSRRGTHKNSSPASVVPSRSLRWSCRAATTARVVGSPLTPVCYTPFSVLRDSARRCSCSTAGLRGHVGRHRRRARGASGSGRSALPCGSCRANGPRGVPRRSARRLR
ncbi:hypothetical protein Deipe_4300 (plasmid) [Deinococcus peraridilitoris DSM 19664]|uniref:Uncharacterized protein n=1 Tax=Deinococcus peraridilitoris (strain DSM 19664 / LMG 22246 / CIP 109416 / KR-200) TaxID=937777 RepID=L0A755_DEIPD|nr:hypothetical protein Deipe_4300 [Deinococcus peraridilitoris DSM 19664]